MTKIDAQLKDAILKDKPTMSTKQLQEKYSLSRSSIQRIKLPDLEARADEFSPAPPPIDQNEAARVVDNLVKEAQQEVHIPYVPPPLPPLAPPKEQTIQRIIMNLETFPAHFPFVTDKGSFIKDLATHSAFELADILKTMETTRTMNNLSAQMKQVFFLTARATEALGSRIRLKTQGLTDALIQQQQELDYIFKELAIDYAGKFSTTTRPEVKLLMAFGMAVLTVDSQNRLRESLKPEEKFADL